MEQNSEYKPIFVKFDLDEVQDTNSSLNLNHKLDIDDFKEDTCEIVSIKTDRELSTLESSRTLTKSFRVKIESSFITVADLVGVYVSISVQSVAKRAVNLGIHTCLNETIDFTTDRLRHATDVYFFTIHGNIDTSLHNKYVAGGVSLTLLPITERNLLAFCHSKNVSSSGHYSSTDAEDDAYNIVPFTPSLPSFSKSSLCSQCQARFGFSRFRHHCRNCGESFCGKDSTKRRCLPHFGCHTPLRVCNSCAYLLDEEQQRQIIFWRKQRVKDFLSGQLQLYRHPEHDRSVDKALRVARGAMHVLNVVQVFYPLRLLLESLDVLCRYGVAGISAMLLRQDFVEAAELLVRICSFEQHKISFSEFMACMYYKFALDKGSRGHDPESDFRQHCTETHQLDNEAYLSDTCPSRMPATHVHGDGNTMKDTDLDEAIRIAPLALIAVYEDQPADMQLIAHSQGWDLLFAHLDSKPEQPAFALFASKGADDSAGNCTKPCKAVLCIRGTRTVHDLVTDVRAAPCCFPPAPEVVENAWKGERNHQYSRATVEATPPLEHDSVDSNMEIAESDKNFEGTDMADEWIQVEGNSDSTRACGGIARAALWLLTETGQVLLDLYNSGYSISIAGHSLGGAVGALLSLLLRPRIQDVRCWTYGSPCCIDKTLSDALKPFVTSIVLGDDPISRFTPRSIRELVRTLVRSRHTVSEYMQADWNDAMRRLAGIWTPRRRAATYDSLSSKCQPRGSEEFAAENIIRAQNHEQILQSCNVENDANVVLDQFPSDAQSEDFILVEDEPLVDLYLPGNVVHIYSHHGQPHASLVSSSFAVLRSISLHAHMFDDHRAKTIFDALLESRAVRKASKLPPRWAHYGSADRCSCCHNKFTWHSTFNSQAQAQRDKHNCRQCGLLCCGPCSEFQRTLPEFGIIFPVRICVACYYRG